VFERFWTCFPGLSIPVTKIFTQKPKKVYKASYGGFKTMTFKDILKHFGTVDRASMSLHYTRMAIYNWQKRGIPYRTQIVIQAVTGGKLKAEKKK